MKHLILILSILFVVNACTKDENYPDVHPTSVYGKYNVSYHDDTWTWNFGSDNKLETIYNGNLNVCGTYFYSNHTDTLVVVNAITPSKVYRGVVYVKNDTTYFQTQLGLMIFEK